MGMYDTLLINTNCLPISAEEIELLSKEEFQTKSLDNCLICYRITDEGFLECEESSRELLRTSSTGTNWKRVDEVHGYVTFYTMTKAKEWYEFIAKFTDGKLVKIFRNEGVSYEGNRRCDGAFF